MSSAHIYEPVNFGTDRDNDPDLVCIFGGEIKYSFQQYHRMDILPVFNTNSLQKTSVNMVHSYFTQNKIHTAIHDGKI